MVDEAQALHQADQQDGPLQISLVVPTRNEAANIRPLLERLTEALRDFAIEIVFVDDSTDDTVAVLEAVRPRFPLDISIIARPPEARNGLSGAVVDGLRAARGQWVCVMDADLQHPPETIPHLWEQAQRTGADLVVGSRRGNLFGPLGLSPLRSLNSKTLTILARMLFPQVLKSVSDPLTGLFLVRRTAVDVDALQPDGFKILLEILVRSPMLQVSEVHFDFAQRHGGDSKADVREGGRFLRHLLRLRTTANAHLGRFVVLVVMGLLANTALLAALLHSGLSPLWGGLLAAELLWLAFFAGMEYWVFVEREHAGSRRRFWGHFLLTQLTLLLLYLPFVLLMQVIGLPRPLLVNFLALVLVGLARYIVSEQWIWTRGSFVWQRQTYSYDIHGIIAIESQVPLRDLAHFESSLAPEEADLQIRVDRQGTPSQVTGGISYDEHLGRFGFGLTVVPGAYTQIVVSPLLERSPEFLFTNVIEPILRWRFVQQGYALVKAAAVAAPDGAIILHADRDMAHIVSDLCRTFGYGFMADDMALLSAGGDVFCYPKPVTVDRAMLQGSAGPAGTTERLAMRAQQLLYTRPLRSVALWFSKQELPAASINTYVQRLVPQPKRALTTLYPEISIKERAGLKLVVCAAPGAEDDARQDMVARQLAQGLAAANFQPHPLLAERLRSWDGIDLYAREQELIRSALSGASIRPFPENADWWEIVGFGTAAAREGAHVPDGLQMRVAPDSGVEAHGSPGTI